MNPQVVGGAAIAVTLIHLLIRLYKSDYGAALLGRFAAHRPWIRPVLGVGIGALTAFGAALAAGQGIQKSLLAAGGGVLAGLGASGLNETLGALTSDGRAAADAKAAVMALATASDADVQKHADVLKAKIDAAVALPDKAGRLAALAAVANKA